MAGKDAPNLPRISGDRLANFEIFERNSLAVEHSIDVVIGQHKQGGGIGKGLILCKPTGLSVAVRADDRQIFDTCVKGPCDFSCVGIWRKYAIGMEEHAL